MESKILETDIRFKKIQGEGCGWGKNGNLTPKNKEPRARVKQEEVIRLPDGAKFCDLNLVAKETAVKYDDGIALTLNNNVLFGGNYNYEDLPQKNGVSQWDWKRFLETFSRENHPEYCYGDCIIPKTQETGRLEYDLSSDKGENIIENLENSASLTFGLYIFGDNDPDKDCSHSGITFAAEITYIEED